MQSAGNAFADFGMKSMQPVTDILESMKKLNTEMKAFQDKVGGMGGVGGTKAGKAMSNLRGEQWRLQIEMLDQIILKRREMLKLVIDTGQAEGVRKRALQEWDILGIKIADLRRSIKLFHDITIAGVMDDLAKKNKKLSDQMDAFWHKVYLAAIKNFKKIMEEFVKAGEATTDRMAQRFLRQIASVKSIVAAARGLDKIELAGLTRTLTVEQQVMRAREDAIVKIQ